MYIYARSLHPFPHERVESGHETKSNTQWLDIKALPGSIANHYIWVARVSSLAFYCSHRSSTTPQWQSYLVGWQLHMPRVSKVQSIFISRQLKIFPLFCYSVIPYSAFYRHLKDSLAGPQWDQEQQKLKYTLYGSSWQKEKCFRLATNRAITSSDRVAAVILVGWQQIL